MDGGHTGEDITPLSTTLRVGVPLRRPVSQSLAGPLSALDFKLLGWRFDVRSSPLLHARANLAADRVEVPQQPRFDVGGLDDLKLV